MAAVKLFGSTEVLYNRLGGVLNAGTIETFAGGTDTPLVTYSNVGLSIENATTLTCNSSGILPADVYVNSVVPYRIVCKTAASVPVFVQDQAFQTSFAVSPAGSVVSLTGNAITIMSGTGSPEGAVAAIVGSLFLRTNGGANTTLYIKESGSGNTGWVAK